MWTMLIIIGGILMVAGLMYILVGVGQFIGAVLVQLIGVLYSAFCGLFTTTTRAIENVGARTDKELQEYIEADEVASKTAEAECERKFQEQLNAKQDKVVLASMLKARELKTKYPLADERLFEDYEYGFNNLSAEELHDMEKKMENQHQERYKQKYLSVDRNVNDLKNLKCIKTEKQYPLTANIYQDGANFIVSVVNEINQSTVMNTYNSINKAYSAMDKIFNKQRRTNEEWEIANADINSFNNKRLLNMANQMPTVRYSPL